MFKILRLLLQREFILFLALALGLFIGQGAKLTEKTVLPALAIIMTLATMSIPDRIFREPRQIILNSLAGLGMNYGILTSFILVCNFLFINDEALRTGFVLLAAVPPAVAVIPFSVMLKGRSSFALLATVGCYLGALVLTPIITIGFLGSGFVKINKIAIIMAELILLPLIFSRVLIWIKVAPRLEPYKGKIINWGFFLVVYTIVGLNQELFLRQTYILLIPALIALGSTFLLGFIIDKISRLWHIDHPMRINLVLLGTHKNTGLAGGLALALYSEKTALPATITTVFMLVYVIWLSFQGRRSAASR
ncbi:MAG: bile acid:sodium symporter family protein [bacterium]